ncbi:MAG: hypothetical protein F6J87_16040 [Spirulina sp. SIO3F2]|nr:hypothetical protein [Spirulina sp. SIO3F2]
MFFAEGGAVDKSKAFHQVLGGVIVFVYDGERLVSLVGDWEQWFDN